jgi:hypothetical protein
VAGSSDTQFYTDKGILENARFLYQGLFDGDQFKICHFVE